MLFKFLQKFKRTKIPVVKLGDPIYISCGGESVLLVWVEEVTVNIQSVSTATCSNAKLFNRVTYYN